MSMNRQPKPTGEPLSPSNIFFTIKPRFQVFSQNGSLSVVHGEISLLSSNFRERNKEFGFLSTPCKSTILQVCFDATGYGLQILRLHPDFVILAFKTDRPTVGH